MSDAGEIAKLAELRDKNIITEREFRRKKAEILQPEKRRGLLWFIAASIRSIGILCAVAIVIGVVAVLPDEAKRHLITPMCNSDEVRQALGKAIAEGPTSHILNLKLLRLEFLVDTDIGAFLN